MSRQREFVVFRIDRIPVRGEEPVTMPGYTGYAR
jgi:hypothetical protein